MNAGILTQGCLGQFSRGGDPRSRRGRRYPLSGLLAMLILAALHGEKSLRGMWIWACKRWESLRCPLGFVGNPRPPAYTTVWYVVTALDSDALDRALQEWTLSWSTQGVRSLSVDGKVLRGSRRMNPEQPALEVLTAAGQQLKVVLGQRGVSDGDAVAATVELLKGMPLKDKLVTADAGLLCRPVIDTILEGEGDYLGLVKDNQPDLKEAVDEWVEPSVFPLRQGTSAG
jgi:hypothetical protein